MWLGGGAREDKTTRHGQLPGLRRSSASSYLYRCAHAALPCSSPSCLAAAGWGFSVHRVCALVGLRLVVRTVPNPNGQLSTINERGDVQKSSGGMGGWVDGDGGGERKKWNHFAIVCNQCSNHDLPPSSNIEHPLCTTLEGSTEKK